MNDVHIVVDTIVLDSWSVIAYLQDEDSAEKIENWISDVINQDGKVLMSVVNVGEVWYIFAREQSVKNADAAISDLQKIGVQFVSADWALTKMAAAFKARGGLSYADSFAAALAQQRQCELVTGDAEFRVVATDVKIRWATP